MTTKLDPTFVYGIAHRSETLWSYRDSKITSFRDWVSQVDYKQRAKKGKYKRFEGNESGTFYSTMTQPLSKHPMKHRIPLGFDDQKERELKGKVERLIDGVYRDVDYRRGRRLDPCDLQESAAKFACSDGWTCAEVIRRTEPDKEPIDIRLYDTLDVYPEWGPDDLHSVVIKTRRTHLQVQLEYDHIDIGEEYVYKEAGRGSTLGGYKRQWQKGNELVDVYVCYYVDKDEDVYYGVVVNGEWAVEPYKLTWTSRIPVVCMTYNGLPFRSEHRTSIAGEETNPDKAPQILDDWTVNVGRGIFYMNYQLYETFNELWANILDMIDAESKGTWYKKTSGGEDSDLLIGQGGHAVNALDKDDEIGRVPPGQLSPEVANMLMNMSGMLQRGGISWQLMGQAGQYQSGFAITQLINAAMTIATPYIKGLKKFYQQLDELVVDALKSQDRKLTVRAYKDKSFVEEEIDLSLLKDRKFYFDVDLRPGLPEDLASRIQGAQISKREGLFDDWTILDEILQVDDPELILARKDEQEVFNLPTIKLRRMAALMLRQGRRDDAAVIMQEVVRLEAQGKLQEANVGAQLMQLEQMMGMGQQPGMPGAGSDVSMETGLGGPGVGGAAPEANPYMNAAASGMSPSVLPPELSGVQPAEQRAGGFLQSIGRFFGG